MVEDSVSGAEIAAAPCLLALTGACLPLCLGVGEKEPVWSRLALLWYLLNCLFCEWARLQIKLEPFVGKFSLFLFFFPLLPSHSLGCYLMLAPSDYPHTFSTVLTLSNIAGIYLSAPTCWWWTEPLGYFSWDLWLGTLSVFCCFFSPAPSYVAL